MSARPFGYDPLTGVREVFRYDEETDTFTIETVQDVTGIVERAKDAYAQVDERARWGEGQVVASIPLVVYYDLMRRGVLRDEQAFRRWLDDPENRFFRTRPGKLSR